ncbi:dUTP diphosphatase [bacterium]|nr:dUTP diphosphatase [bacterium]
MERVRIINKSKNPLPEYKTELAAGLDLMADLSEEVQIKPGERVLIDTGIHIALPKGFEAQIRPRSGLALKFGVTVLNSPGTIDADYRGEVKVLLINHSGEIFKVNNGDRIAQMIIAKYEKIQWEQSETLDATERGSGGYGHTGTN